MIGGVVGAVLGLAGLVAMRFIAARIESKAQPGDARSASTANLMRTIAIADLIILTLVGYFVGPLVLGRS
jgi:hypothetical protein